MKKTFALFALLICNSAIASNWQYLPDEFIGVSIQVDIDSIAADGKYRKAWVFYKFDEPKQFYYGKTYRSTLSLNYYDCQQRQFMSKQAVSYKEEYRSSEQIHSQNIPVTPDAFHDVAPDSLGETLLNFVCRYKRR